MGFASLSRRERVAAMRRRVRGLGARSPFRNCQTAAASPGRAKGSPNQLGELEVGDRGTTRRRRREACSFAKN